MQSICNICAYRNIIYIYIFDPSHETYLKLILLMQFFCGTLLTDCIGSEWTLKGHFVQPSCGQQGCHQLDQAAQSLTSLFTNCSHGIEALSLTHSHTEKQKIQNPASSQISLPDSAVNDCHKLPYCSFPKPLSVASQHSLKG